MAMTFDATLQKHGPGQSPGLPGCLRSGAVSFRKKLLNVQLSTVTTAADLILALGEPLEEIIHLDFQSSAATRKHADLLAYNALLFAHCLVPIHTIILLLRPEAAHSNG
jgi:hypothetical protein